MKNRAVLLSSSALWSLYEGMTSLYLVAFALELGASNTVVGLLGALPWLASILTQIPGAQLIEHYSRKSIMIGFGFFNRVLWIPILLSPFLMKEPLMAVVVFFLLAKIAETIMDPSWASVMADIVPEKIRGKFFSKRFTLLGLFGMSAMLVGGFILKQIPGMKGFAVLFGIGAVAGILSTSLVRKLREPEFSDHEHHHIKEFFTLSGALKKFVAFGVAFNFAFMIASPFFAVYLLKNLGVNYWFYGIIMSIATASQIISVRYIGRLTDRFGDKPIAVLGHLGSAFVPLVYLAVTAENLWLLIPIQIFSGVTWAAADLSRFNLLLGLSNTKKRAMQIAEYNLYASVPLVAAPLIGGWITDNVTFILAGIPLIFVISGILRFITALMLIRIPEPRAKHEYSPFFVFKEALHLHPNKGIVHSLQIVRRAAVGLGLK